jgi:hypothetical protein
MEKNSQIRNRTSDRFAAQLDRRMAHTITATQRAVVAVIALRDRRPGAIGSEISRLESAFCELGRIKVQIVSLNGAADSGTSLAVCEREAP